MNDVIVPEAAVPPTYQSPRQPPDARIGRSGSGTLHAPVSGSCDATPSEPDGCTPDGPHGEDRPADVVVPVGAAPRPYGDAPVGPLSGVQAGSEWRGGDLIEVENAVDDLAGYDPGEVEAATLAARLENGIIPHPSLEAAKKALRLHQLRSFPLDGRAPQPGHLVMVTGAPGAGKSTLLRLHKKRFHDVRDRDGLRITAVLAEMPSPCTKKGVVEAIFRAMQHEVPKDWNSADIIEEIANLVQKHHTRMIMLDEADRIFGVDTDAVAKFLVSLLNVVKAQFVLAGAPRILNLNTGYGLERRTEEDVVLAPYRFDTGEGQRNFRALLAVFDLRLGLGRKIGLNEFDLSRRIYVATGGHVGIVSKLLVATLRRAVERERDFDRKLLGEVWMDLRRKEVEQEEIDFDCDVLVNPAKPQPPVPPSQNPFLCKPDRVKQIWLAQIAATAKAAADAEAERRGRRRLRQRTVPAA